MIVAIPWCAVAAQRRGGAAVASLPSHHVSLPAAVKKGGAAVSLSLGFIHVLYPISFTPTLDNNGRIQAHPGQTRGLQRYWSRIQFHPREIWPGNEEDGRWNVPLPKWVDESGVFSLPTLHAHFQVMAFIFWWWMGSGRSLIIGKTCVTIADSAQRNAVKCFPSPATPAGWRAAGGWRAGRQAGRRGWWLCLARGRTFTTSISFTLVSIR